MFFDSLTFDPIAFTLPFGENGFPIYWYGIIITLGIAIGSVWAGREISRRGRSADELYNGLLIVVIAGYLGARLGYVFLDALDGGQYNSLWEIVNLRSGGANIMFGFILAALAGYIFVKFRRLNFWDYADVAGPALLIAQGIGRWGNFINQELYGPPTGSDSWGLLIEGNHRIVPFNNLSLYPLETRFHPTFFYESIWLILGFALLVFLNNRNRDTWRKGTLFGLFLIWWGAGRAVIELFRPDQTVIAGPVTWSMLVSILFVLGGIYILLARYDKIKSNSNARRRRVIKPKPRRS